MEFILVAVLSHILDVGHATMNVTISLPHNVSEEAGVQVLNQTGEVYTPQLSHGCYGMLRVLNMGTWMGVSLPPESRERQARQICMRLGCGDVYELEESRTTSSMRCLQGCVYNSTHLENCTQVEPGNCSHVMDVSCGHRAVRLAEGGDRCAGRVELWDAGHWGTVCDDQWDLQDGHVVCAQMGCGYALNVSGQGSSYAGGQGDILLDDINCNGTEKNLWECPALHLSQDCGHKEDAGVVCSEFRAVRLTGGLDRCSGRVEIHRNGTWGTLCDTCWSTQEASMVCSMLDCGTVVNYTAFTTPFQNSEEARWYVLCSPQDANLWQCREFFSPPFLCKGSKAAGVVCSKSIGLPPPTIIPPATTQTSATTEHITVSGRPGYAFRLPASVLGCLVLSFILMVVLCVNVILCIKCQRRHSQQGAEKHKTPNDQESDSTDTIDLIKVTASSTGPSSSRRLHVQLSVENSSLESDYEHYEPSVTMSTFQNSLRNRTDSNNPPKAPPLHSLPEEGNPLSSTSSEEHRDQSNNASLGSFDSCTSSEDECYENTGANIPLEEDNPPNPDDCSEDPFCTLLGTCEEEWSEEDQQLCQADGNYDDIANYRR